MKQEIQYVLCDCYIYANPLCVQASQLQIHWAELYDSMGGKYFSHAYRSVMEGASCRVSIIFTISQSNPHCNNWNQSSTVEVCYSSSRPKLKQKLKGSWLFNGHCSNIYTFLLVSSVSCLHFLQPSCYRSISSTSLPRQYEAHLEI